MVETVISIRTARHGDEIQIARVHDAAWRDAYQGVIPGRELERMIARRGPAWWRQAIVGGTRLMVLDFSETVAGSARYGRNRMAALAYNGQVFALYLAGECSTPRAAISPRTAIYPSSYGRSPATIGRWSSTGGWAVASSGAPRNDSAPRRASGSPSASSSESPPADRAHSEGGV